MGLEETDLTESITSSWWRRGSRFRLRPVVAGRLEIRAAIGRFGEAEFPAASIVMVRIEREYVTGAVRLDVAAPGAARHLSVADPLGRLPGAARAGGSSCNKGNRGVCGRWHLCMPNDVDLVLEGRGLAVVRPHDRPVGGGLRSRQRGLEIPGGAAVCRIVRPKSVGLIVGNRIGSPNANGDRPRGSVRCPIDRRIGVS